MFPQEGKSFPLACEKGKQFRPPAHILWLVPERSIGQEKIIRGTDGISCHDFRPSLSCALSRPDNVNATRCFFGP